LIEAEIGWLELDRAGAAAVNSMTAMYANQLYSSDEDFVWLMKDNRVGQASDLLAALGEEQQGDCSE
jgi:hypothetical protein